MLLFSPLQSVDILKYTKMWIFIILNIEWECKWLDTLVELIDLICRKWVMSFDLSTHTIILSLSFTLVKKYSFLILLGSRAARWIYIMCEVIIVKENNFISYYMLSFYSFCLHILNHLSNEACFKNTKNLGFTKKIHFLSMKEEYYCENFHASVN